MNNLFIILIVCVVTIGLISCSTTVNGSGKPNILFILVDDLGYTDLSVTGAKHWKTPNIDKLAQEGMLFTNAYAAGMICSPTRASLITGKQSARIGITDWIPGERQPKNRPIVYRRTKVKIPIAEYTIAEALKEVGYQTIHIGKWHLGKKTQNSYPQDHGFDVNIGGSDWGHPHRGFFSPYKIDGLKDGPKGEYLTYRLTKEAIGMLKKSARSKKPFFMHLSYYTVHSPFMAPKKIVDKYRNNPNIPVPEFAAMIECLDTSVGKLMKTLKQVGLDKNTIVFFYSDNGGDSAALRTKKHKQWLRTTPYRGAKGDLYEGGIKSPLIVRYPGKIKAGTVSQALINTPDLYPTFLDLTGAFTFNSNNPKKLMMEKQVVDGVTFAGELFGEQNAYFTNRTLYWDFPHYRAGSLTSGAGTMRTGKYKLINFYETDAIELYDIEKDFAERNNLVEAMPQKAKQMHTTFRAWRKEIGAFPIVKNPNYKP